MLRTLFLDFENKDWEEELADFHNTDVEVPATLTVDGKNTPTSASTSAACRRSWSCPDGSKRSLNLSIDLADDDQRLHGYKTLNLLNAHGDPSFLHTVLYSHIARQYIPAPEGEPRKVVINGESWGVYVNAQQFNKEFVRERFKAQGRRALEGPGSPGGRGGLEYLGDNVDDYKRHLRDQVERRRAVVEGPDPAVQGAQRDAGRQAGGGAGADAGHRRRAGFLALDVALVNSDGYWIRASDYSLYLDEKGNFHVVPHDMNEALEDEGGRAPPAGSPEGQAVSSRHPAFNCRPDFSFRPPSVRPAPKL